MVTGEDGGDSIAIRHFLHLTLGFDHRIIDGADAGRFMAEVKKYLEGWNETENGRGFCTEVRRD